MHRDHTVGVVIPTYNNADRIADLLRSLPALADRIVVVDDASSDGTLAIVRRTIGGPESRFGARFKVLYHPRTLGLGAAIVTGYRALLALGTDVIVTVDPREPLDAGDVEKLTDPIAAGEADFVKGTRLHGRHARELARPDYVGGRLLSFLARWATGAGHVLDVTCVHHALSRDALATLPLSELWPGAGFSLDLDARIGRMGLVAASVPVRSMDHRILSRRVPRRLAMVVGRAAVRRFQPKRRPRILPPHARAEARVQAARAVGQSRTAIVPRGEVEPAFGRKR